MTDYMYISECADGSYYVGSTNNLEARLYQHQTGDGANYTNKRLPVELAYCEEFDRIDDAFAHEKQVQGWSHAKKQALIDGQYDDLPALAKKTFHPAASIHCLRQHSATGVDDSATGVDASVTGLDSITREHSVVEQTPKCVKPTPSVVECSEQSEERIETTLLQKEAKLNKVTSTPLSDRHGLSNRSSNNAHRSVSNVYRSLSEVETTNQEQLP